MLGVYMKRLICVISLCIANISYANTLEEFFSIARVNADKFESEIPHLKRTVTFRYKPSSSSILQSARYDHLNQKLSIYEIFGFLDRWIEKCKPISVENGMNSFGAKGVFTRFKCNQIVLNDEWRYGVASDSEPLAVIPMSPSEFRAIKSDGPTLEIVFQLIANSNGEIFKSFDNIQKATINDPREKQIKGFHVHGGILKLTLYSPDGKKNWLVLTEKDVLILNLRTA